MSTPSIKHLLVWIILLPSAARGEMTLTGGAIGGALANAATAALFAGLFVLLIMSLSRRIRPVFRAAALLSAIIVPTASGAVFVGGGTGNNNFSNSDNWKEGVVPGSNVAITFDNAAVASRTNPAVVDSSWTGMGGNTAVYRFDAGGVFMSVASGATLKPSNLEIGSRNNTGDFLTGSITVQTGGAIDTAATNSGVIWLGTGNSAGEIILEPGAAIRYGRLIQGTNGILRFQFGANEVARFVNVQSSAQNDYSLNGRVVVDLTALEAEGGYVLMDSRLSVITGAMATWLGGEGGAFTGNGSGIFGGGVFEVVNGGGWEWTLSLADEGRDLQFIAGTGSGPAEPVAYANIPYGPHARNLLDLWVPPTVEPAPLLMFIHGGSWLGNDKSSVPAGLVSFCLDNGIAIASVNYRYSSDAPLPAPVHDAARALQFLRANAATYHIDKTRITLEGTSAGACSALWIALHDDLADPTSDDPVLRESTRVRGVALNSGQTSIDPGVISDWVGDIVLTHNMIIRAAGALTRAEMLARYEELAPIYEEFSPINHLDVGDPPVFLSYSGAESVPADDANHAIHHPEFGKRFKALADSLGQDTRLYVNTPLGTAKGNFHLEVLAPRALPADPPQAVQIALAADGLKLSLQSQDGVLYQLQNSATMGDNTWTDDGPPVSGHGGTLEITRPRPAADKAFYRIQVNAASVQPE